MRSPARRVLSAAMAAVAACAALLMGAGPVHAALPPAELRAVTDNYLFSVSIGSFLSARNAQAYGDQLDWSSDACSWSPDEPLGYDFTPSCYRHDFGYRNYRAQGRFTESARLAIDNNFRDDMYDECAGNSTCRGVANVYYWAVREFGASSASTAEALERAGAEQQARALIARAEASGRPVG
ncbi:phospholipase [Allonocardiopsis opalescens]|uniref:Phospholipase A2-like protein n=1 Tax=Allonocardiopsis opalescens TaxID=1144618 RepID=A0A2T0Q4P5_9ACTN|nr:phospholipase [Allonocardiopsis opalescens]PRX98788.1 phospholipase A2-like protein [Allonocardiopsis opalescens]